MADPGYIYILINPSMEGLIKIGKTTRCVKDRASELSKSTGVPTHFIVAYETNVKNCTRAEEFVHTLLAKKGYRINPNREFFNAPVTEAVNAILEYQKIDDQFDDKGVITEDDNSNDSPAWMEEEMLGLQCLTGSNSTILQDYKDAAEHLHNAIKLGSVTAYSYLGMMYLDGLAGCPQNDDTAIDYYKSAIQYGDHTCYGCMMIAYFNKNHVENAVKCWNQYLAYMDQDKMVARIAGEYVKQCIFDVVKLDRKSLGKISPYFNKVHEYIEESFRSSANSHGQEKIDTDEEMLQTVLAYLAYLSKLSSNDKILTFNEMLPELIQKLGWNTGDEGLDDGRIQPSPIEYEEKLAVDAFFGNGDTIQSYGVAIKHFKNAIKLGSIRSYRFLGLCFKNGYGCSKNSDTALEYFTDGAEHGDNYCYGEMADIFFWIGHIDNAIKCWNKYIDYIEDDPFLPVIACNYMGHCLKNGMEPNLQSIRKMHKRMHEIIPDVQAIVNMFQRNGAYSVEEIQNQNNFKAILNYCYYVKSVQNVEDILSYNCCCSSNLSQSCSQLLP